MTAATYSSAFNLAPPGAITLAAFRCSRATLVAPASRARASQTPEDGLAVQSRRKAWPSQAPRNSPLGPSNQKRQVAPSAESARTPKPDD